MITTTGNEVANHSITDYLGIVHGIVVRNPSFGQGILGGISSLFTGVNIPLTTYCAELRKEALQLMEENAEQLGAHAVIGLRFDSSHVGIQSAALVAYGTAVSLVRHAD